MNSVLVWHMEGDIRKNHHKCMSLGMEIHQI